MLKLISVIGLSLMALACQQNKQRQANLSAGQKSDSFRLYSKDISDSFSVFVHFPNDYDQQKKDRYPVVYLLDANLYFDILASVLDKYSEVGLAPSVILVGIGYKDFFAMDSLRNRDDTYPTAIPEYEMAVSGGACKFLSFINADLIPQIDSKYKSDTSKRIMMGHSLGGYFVTYAFLQDLSGKSKSFSSYIAASPSLHYNRYWILNQLKEIGAMYEQKKKNLYISYGGLEDAQDENDSNSMKPGNLTNQLSLMISQKQSNFVNYKCDVFSNLNHMDTQLPTFIKGLQWVSGETK